MILVIYYLIHLLTIAIKYVTVGEELKQQLMYPKNTIFISKSLFQLTLVIFICI
jgi:hypothetical protein